MKKTLLAFVSLFMLTLAAVAGEPTKVLTFPAEGGAEISSYTSDWTATVGDDVWNISGFNSNKNGWTFIKAGRKNVDQLNAYIQSPAVNAAITDVVITVDKTSNVTKATLTILNGEEVVETKDIIDAFKAGDVDVKVAGKAGYSYKLTLDHSSASGNGPTQISKVALYEEGQYVADAPIANTAETAYTVAEARALIDAGKSLTDVVFVKGIICKIEGIYSNKISYWISDDGTETNAMECYNGLNKGGAQFEDVDDIEVGAEVVVTGTLTFYAAKSIYELNADNQIVSYKAPQGTGVKGINVNAKANGKYMENGKIVIVKDGKKYNVAGVTVN